MSTRREFIQALAALAGVAKLVEARSVSVTAPRPESLVIAPSIRTGCWIGDIPFKLLSWENVSVPALLGSHYGPIKSAMDRFVPSFDADCLVFEMRGISEQAALLLVSDLPDQHIQIKVNQSTVLNPATAKLKTCGDRWLLTFPARPLSVMVSTDQTFELRGLAKLPEVRLSILPR